jgi:hypothetical protein
VLNHWFDALEDWAPHLDIEYAFVYTPGSDDTLDIISERAPNAHWSTYMAGDHSTKRNWGEESRLRTMADLRNELLKVVRGIEPDLFLSLDSDILVPPWFDARVLFDEFDDAPYDGVALLSYLGLGSITNAFYEDRHRRTRAKVYDALAPVDIICASKLMSRELLMDERVAYGYHVAGEDLYWSKTATTYGYRLGLDSRVKCKHIMKPEQLERVDERVGF